MVDQICIRHCKLRLHRSGGWSWGPDPDRLLYLATQALPELITSQLMQLLADQQESLTIDRLSIKIPIKLSELTELLVDSGGVTNHPVLTDRITRKLKQALAVQAGIDCSAYIEPVAVHSSGEMTQPMLAPMAIKDGAALLVEWYRQGTLLQRLKHFSHQALIDWEMLALNSLPESVSAGKNDQRLSIEAEQFIRDLLQSFHRPAEARLERLVVMVALLQRYPERFSKQSLVDLLERVVPLDTSGAEGTHQRDIKNDPIRLLADPSHKTDSEDRYLAVRKRDPAATAIRTPVLQPFEIQVSSVLPFVSLGILSRLGYFDVLSAALKAVGVGSDIHCFAVALAYKMLAAPLRGWYREAVDIQTAAAVAGLNHAVSGEELDRFAFNCRHSLSPADAHLKLLLTQGHDPSCPLLIHSCKIEQQPLWLLMDTQGCFPLGWFSDRADLLQTLEDFVGNTFLISETANETTLFADLSSQRHRFITALPPGRSNQWRPIDRRRQLWTNDLEAQTRWLLKQSQCLPAVTAAADQITRAVILERPVLPTQSQQTYSLPFEQSLALAASSALATIAWQLWGGKETTDPVLTLQRLGNLEGRVTISSEKITVRPLLGRRYQDLYQHNFLVDVINLPWLGGRRLEFAGS